MARVRVTNMPAMATETHRNERPDAIDSAIRVALDAASGERWAEAVVAFDIVMPQLDGPEVPRLWSLYAHVLANSCRIKEAVSALRRALQSDPAEAGDWARLGELLHAMGDQVEAASALRQATAIDPTHSPAWLSRGIVCRVLGRDDEAKACWDRAIALDPGCVGAWRNLGDLHRAAGDLARAADCYETVVGL